jgi:hypothetical protein
LWLLDHGGLNFAIFLAVVGNESIASMAAELISAWCWSCIRTACPGRHSAGGIGTFSARANVELPSAMSAPVFPIEFVTVGNVADSRGRTGAATGPQHTAIT